MNHVSVPKRSFSDYFFHLSGIHERLPTLEILAILESINIPYKISKQYTNCLSVECVEESALVTADRAAYCRRAVKLLYKTIIQNQTLEELAKAIADTVDFTEYVPITNSFLVRVYRIHDASIEYVSEPLEREIGKEIWVQLEGKSNVRMDDPDETFIGLFVDDVFLFGKEVSARKSRFFDDRRADIRPFFKPGTLEPRFARLMANLSQCTNSHYLLDPFCGPGGILLEGALMGAKVIGMDIDRRMIAGAKKNLAHYIPEGDFEFLVGDAKALPFRRNIRSIATDPPYGKSTSTYGKKILNLLEEFFSQAHQVLEHNGLLAIGMLVEIPLDTVAEATGFQLEVFEKIYIHKSLTRRVGVFRKK